MSETATKSLGQRLCEADPEHFKKHRPHPPEVLLHREGYGRNGWLHVGLWELAGWCLDQMPAETDVIYSAARKLYAVCGMGLFKAGTTRQEAILEAYIAWKEAGSNA